MNRLRASPASRAGNGAGWGTGVAVGAGVAVGTGAATVMLIDTAASACRLSVTVSVTM